MVAAAESRGRVGGSAVLGRTGTGEGGGKVCGGGGGMATEVALAGTEAAAVAAVRRAAAMVAAGGGEGGGSGGGDGGGGGGGGGVRGGGAVVRAPMAIWRLPPTPTQLTRAEAALTGTRTRRPGEGSKGQSARRTVAGRSRT